MNTLVHIFDKLIRVFLRWHFRKTWMYCYRVNDYATGNRLKEIYNQTLDQTLEVA